MIIFFLWAYGQVFSEALSPLSIFSKVLSPNLFCRVRKEGTCPRTFDLSHSLFSHWSLTCQYSFVSSCTPESTSNTPLVFLGFGQNYAFRKIWTTDVLIWIMDLQQFSTSYHPAVIKLGKKWQHYNHFLHSVSILDSQNHIQQSLMNTSECVSQLQTRQDNNGTCVCVLDLKITFSWNFLL